MTTWLYDSDPLALLAFEAPLETLKARLASNSRFFENMIARFFLENRHRTTLMLKPDPDLASKEEAAEREQLKAVRKSLQPDQLHEVIANTRELKRLQELPDPPEALAAIPTLKIADLERTNKLIPWSFWKKRASEPSIMTSSPTGSSIWTWGSTSTPLSRSTCLMSPLFGRALVEIGTEKEDFVALTQRISRKTGGIYPDVFTSASKADENGGRCGCF